MAASDSTPRVRYHRKSRESHILEAASNRMSALLDSIVKEHPLPIGEVRIDERTANKRLQQIPPDQLYDHYAKHG